jgi:hypothetical protein
LSKNLDLHRLPPCVVSYRQSHRRFLWHVYILPCLNIGSPNFDNNGQRFHLCLCPYSPRNLIKFYPPAHHTWKWSTLVSNPLTATFVLPLSQFSVKITKRQPQYADKFVLFRFCFRNWALPHKLQKFNVYFGGFLFSSFKR